MQVKILGSAAGGGFPQWNCACPNCTRVREGRFNGRSRSQSQVAVSGDGENWHLLNASPDLRQQILQHPELAPTAPGVVRQSPIQSVTLTNADLDHTLGLLLLRESQPLRIFCTDAIHSSLRGGNSFFRMLDRFEGQTVWTRIEPGVPFKLTGADERSSGVECTPIALAGRAPLYARDGVGVTVTGHVIGLVVRDENAGGIFGYFPALPEITIELRRVFAECDLLFVDGTFWTDDELVRLQPGARSARDMGHVPISGRDGLLEKLDGLPLRMRKCFVHINNTNPILDESGPEFRALEASGWTVGFDGMEFQL